MIPDVIDFEILPDYRIKVTLSTGNRGIFDVKPYLDKGIFQELKDHNYCPPRGMGEKPSPLGEDFSMRGV